MRTTAQTLQLAHLAAQRSEVSGTPGAPTGTGGGADLHASNPGPRPPSLAIAASRPLPRTSDSLPPGPLQQQPPTTSPQNLSRETCAGGGCSSPSHVTTPHDPLGPGRARLPAPASLRRRLLTIGERLHYLRPPLPRAAAPESGSARASSSESSERPRVLSMPGAAPRAAREVPRGAVPLRPLWDPPLRVLQAAAERAGQSRRGGSWEGRVQNKPRPRQEGRRAGSHSSSLRFSTPNRAQSL